jgi:hypothetical protein
LRRSVSVDARGGRPSEATRARGKASSPTQLVAGLIWLVPVILAAAYGAFFLARLRDSITALLWNSDYASGFTLAQTVAGLGSGGHTVISTTGAYVPLWFGLLTAHLPFHRQLWEIAPTLIFIGTALVIGGSVARIAGRRAAAGAVMIVLIASPWTLAIVMAPVAHNTVYPATALLGAYLPWLIRREALGRFTAVAVAVGAGVILGVAIASDALVIVTGVVPLGLAAVLAVIQPSRRARVAGGYALMTVAAAVPVAIATNAIMKAVGYVITAPALSLAPLSSVWSHVRLLANGLRDLSNGYLGAGWPGTLHAEVGTACTVVLILSLVALLAIGVRGSVSLLRRHRHDDRDLTRLLHVGYWFSSAVVVCGAFLFTTAAGNGLSPHESYYLTIVFSVAAMVTLIDRPEVAARWLIPVGLAIFAVGSIIGLKRDYLNTYRPPLAAYASTIVRLAEIDHATTGYAGYWDASNLTWSTREHVRVRPLEQCANPRGAPICPFFLMRSPYWYVAKPRRTFLLVDPSQLYVITLPTGLGKPIASYRFGKITMYVYPYDIASRLGPPPT